MTNPLRETDSPSTGSEAHNEAHRGSPPEPGSQASPISKSGTAGAESQDAPRQFTADEVFRILVEAVAALEAAGKPAIAAGVSARMRMVQPGFSVENTEFSSFRDLTRAAEAAGFVDAIRGANDFVLKLRTPAVRPVQGATLRPDLWRAIQDWTGGVTYAFDRVTHRTEPVGGRIPAHAVLAPSVNKATTVEWMSQFAAKQRADIRATLEAGLSEEDPVAGFQRAVKATDGLRRRWNGFLRDMVLGIAAVWASENQIPRSDIFVPTESGRPAAPRPTTEDEALRQRILDILKSMPLHELLRLPIPLEHALIR